MGLLWTFVPGDVFSTVAWISVLEAEAFSNECWQENKD
jgi:hypothetical protein